MNILSISQVEQISPQIQTADYKKSESLSNSSSFADELKRANEKAESVNDSNKLARQDENQNQPVKKTENPESEKSEKSDEKSLKEKNPKTAKVDSKEEARQEEEDLTINKGLLMRSDLASLFMSAEEVNRLNQTNEKVLDMSQALDAENFALTEKIAEAGDKTEGEIDDKMLAWLISSADSDEKGKIGDNLSKDDLASLIENAEDFIPGQKNEGEELSAAQKLSTTDPQAFLLNMQKLNPSDKVAKNADDKVELKKSASKDKTHEVRFTVHDLRTEKPLTELDSSKAVQKAAEKKEIQLTMKQQNDNNVQMTMELAGRAQENITSSSSQTAAANGSDFQQMLSNAIQENAPDFVKAGNIMLKDNNQGSINLILRPEGLGNVKISLNLDDKNLSAQISVQTKEAMEAFKESIPALKQAFTESGFETGSFDLNFSNQQNFAQNGNGGDGQRQENSVLAQKSYGDYVSSESRVESEAAPAVSGDYSVNIVA